VTLRGNPCATCASPLVSFGQFLCEVDVNTVLRCNACGTALRRSRVEFAMLGGLGLAFAAAGYALVRMTLGDPTAAGLVTLALFFVGAPPVLFVLAKFIGWKFIPWVAVEPTARRPVAEA
jgi:hypothetical protein